MISVIMSVYDESDEHLNASISSILNQTWTDFEFIIVNDNPDSNRVKSLLLSITDPRVKVIYNDYNIGLARSLNLALKFSKGEYIARMDADDISFVDRLSRQLIYLKKNSDVFLCGTNIVFIDENGCHLGFNKKVETSFEKIKTGLKFSNMLHHPTWMFRKDLIDAIGYYNNLSSSQDYDFLLRCITLNYKVVNLTDKLLYYRFRLDSISNKKKFEQNSTAHFLQSKYFKFFPQGKTKSYNDFKFDLIKKELRFNEIVSLKRKNKMFTLLFLVFFPFFFFKNIKNKFLYFVLIGKKYE